MSIKIENLTKQYSEVVALNDISLSIPNKKKVGLIGHNGSGKTTLLEILCGIKGYNKGHINIKFDKEYKEHLGVILQNNAFYNDAKVIELLNLFATFYKSHIDLEYLIDLVGIKEYKDKFYSRLSGGMKQRVNIALALINDPKILILDEPTTGLDPIARKDLWNIINQFSENSLVLISSHYMDEIEKNCDYVIFLKEGKVVEADYTHIILKKYNASLEDIYIRVNGKRGENNEKFI